jgi:3-hydroxymyristoyl/3-hydroxydecanoyl-(acyl carrier protein) dehydratase
MRDWLPLEELRPEEGGVVEASASLAADSPWFEGHFPGNPVFPGLGLLALVEEAARRGLQLSAGSWHLEGLRRVRFRKALRPGARLALHIRATRSEREVQADFQLREDGDDVGRGVLLFLATGLDPAG